LDADSPKRRQIFEAARVLFAEHGFEHVSVDQIASKAGVSKATVYSHFADKKALFVACFSEEADELRARLRACLAEPKGELVPSLEAAARGLLGVLLSPAIVALYRVTTAEAVRFPEIAESLWERGPSVVRRAIAGFLEAWSDRGALSFEDSDQAALDFAKLVEGDLYLRAQLGLLKHPATDEIARAAQHAVAVFLRAYGRK
jgi:TetR/AcrR family transcriptional repressor of mexJK operon